MEQICSHCTGFIRHGRRSPQHQSISRIRGSELIKCHVCNAYLLSEQDHREVLDTRSDSAIRFASDQSVRTSFFRPSSP